MTKESSLIEAILRQDLYCFIQAAFPTVSPGVPFARNWQLEGEIKRLIITIPLRSLKSICGSVCFPAFALGHDPRVGARQRQTMVFQHFAQTTG